MRFVKKWTIFKEFHPKLDYFGTIFKQNGPLCSISKWQYQAISFMWVPGYTVKGTDGLVQTFKM